MRANCKHCNKSLSEYEQFEVIEIKNDRSSSLLCRECAENLYRDLGLTQEIGRIVPYDWTDPSQFKTSAEMLEHQRKRLSDTL